MKNRKTTHGFIWVIAILLGIANFSCSSKQKLKEIDKEEIKIDTSQKLENTEDTSLNVKVAVVTKVDDKTKITTTKKTTTPVDPAKPASVIDPDGKKHELNNVSITEETTTEETNKQTERSDNSEESQKKVTAAKAASKVRASIEKQARKVYLHKSGFNFWSWFWLIGIVIISIGILYLNHRFKLLKRVTAFFKE